MSNTLRLSTTILPGNRLEICDPDLPEGAAVDVIVTIAQQPASQRTPMAEFIKSLPVGPRVYTTWEEYEQHLHEEKDSWE